MTYSINYFDSTENNPYSRDAIDWDWKKPREWAISHSDGPGCQWQAPESVNECAYEALLSHFNLQNRRDKFPLEKIIKMSPKELALVSNTNPSSGTLGDKTFAMEVD